MDNEFQAVLRRKHPMLLSNPPVTPIYDRGIEVGNGWFDLLAEVFVEIEQVAADSGIAVPPLVQVKEKFGLLRIYAVQPLPEVVSDVLYRAETTSARICESCGQPGSMVNRPGPMRVRCKGCD